MANQCKTRKRAREAAKTWLAGRVSNTPDAVESLTRLLRRTERRARLEEAKWWRDWYNQADNASQYEHHRAVQRIAELEQGGKG